MTIIRTHHSLCRPASPGAIIAKALADSGHSRRWLRKRLGCSSKTLREILSDKFPLSLLEALHIGSALGRDDLALISAQVECKRWDKAERRRLAKERKR